MTNRALVIFRKQIGDVLLLQPGLQLLNQRYSQVDVHTHPAHRDLLSLMPGQIYLAERRILPRYKSVFCLEHRFAALLLSARCLGAHKHLLLSKDRASPLEKLLFEEYRFENNPHLYRARLYHTLFGGSDTTFSRPRLLEPPVSWFYPDALPSAYVVVHPTAAWQHKAWAADNWCKLLRRLPTDIEWVLTSGPASWEVAMAQGIASKLPDHRITNLAGKTNLRQYISVLSKAAAVLCVDGSASHIAAAYGKPTLTLFGSTSAERWHMSDALNHCIKATDFSGTSKPVIDNIPVKAVELATLALLGLKHG